MGFAFNLLFILVVIPLSLILIVVWAISALIEEATHDRSKPALAFKKRLSTIPLALLGLMWGCITCLVVLVGIVHLFDGIDTTRYIRAKDYHGTYVINRNFYPGEQADWQYNHFRFEITRKKKIYFHLTDGERIVKTYEGKIRTIAPYKSHRLIIDMEAPPHILADNPTTYGRWNNFNLVFYSEDFQNVCFRKGKWQSLKD